MLAWPILTSRQPPKNRIPIPADSKGRRPLVQEGSGQDPYIRWPLTKPWLNGCGVKDDLLAGRRARPKGDGLTVRDLVNRFLTTKRQLVESGELTPARGPSITQRASGSLTPSAGLGWSMTWRPMISNPACRHRQSLGARCDCPTRSTACAVVFKYAYDAGLIERPNSLRSRFRRPNAKSYGSPAMPRARGCSRHASYSPFAQGRVATTACDDLSRHQLRIG